MFWDDILILAEEGRDIGSHSMIHKKLKLSDEEMKYLFENEFTIFQMKDVVYDDWELHIKGYEHIQDNKNQQII